MWYAKMYFSEGREIFQYDSLGMQGVPDVQKEFPFLESLLAFQELDCAEVTPILQSITDNWSRQRRGSQGAPGTACGRKRRAGAPV